MSEVGHLRADAQRNREKLLAAARAAFAEHGLEAHLEEIARRAGVGTGTLYRHFPTRDELISAVFLERAAHNSALLQRARDNPDPWAGLTEYIYETARALVADRGLTSVLAVGYPTPELDALRRSTDKARVELIERAKASGQLRADCTPEDLILLLLAVAGIVHHTQAATPAMTDRFLSFALDGFNAHAASPAPPPISRQKIKRTLRRRPQSTQFSDSPRADR